MPHPTRLQPQQSALLVIDVQEKLMVKIPDRHHIETNIAFLIDTAKLLEVPVLATEQYPKGLGPTVDSLIGRLPERPEKTAFSCCGIPSTVETLRGKQVKQVVLVGIEAHVCVLNTALDLMHEGFQVYLVIDALTSRYPIDRDIAFCRLEQVGAIPTTCEGVAFEWMQTSSHPQFKKVSGLVQDRMKQLELKTDN